MNKVLVTGGAGYIAAHTIVELINEQYDVVIIDNLSKSDRTLLNGVEQITGKKLLFREGDAGDSLFMKKVFQNDGPFSCVLHFAAFKSVGESEEKPLMYYQNNVTALTTLTGVMLAHKVHDLIFSSSCTIYGQPDKIPVNEEAPFKRAESAYGASKQMCERILEDVSREGLRVVSLRYFNPIGAHPSALIGELPIGIPNNLVPYVTQTAAGLREKITVFGNDYNTIDGSCVRDFIHVVDLARAHVNAMNFLSRQSALTLYEAFNLGTGEGVSVLQLIEKFKAATSVNVPFVIGPRRPGDIEKVYADPTKANKMLQWKTRFTLEASLRHAWEWEKRIHGLNDKN